jgi:hypothetical protein
MRITTPYKEWTFSRNTVRIPEFCAPGLGNKPNVVTIDAEISPNANGVLYKLGANSGGLTCFVEDGVLCSLWRTAFFVTNTISSSFSVRRFAPSKRYPLAK